ncbi:uncharacterized protein Z518_05190 [Rhinocladiella mackenziei CBS 650.93]|uniref:Uncharacterized protein n=1 Tax=Rhinocladiella mackenziei CBS 650.93 TaxID=1442369 RepID=A0A0D2H1J2_9EURO|nr:uncharacterized protein Z518_05190 [Rhinocladiella mackenziei CBS 650.93]KIX04323.1 hypothetical protein Z518_05190 [Rhinocladiella mackenziei CBS 650.93]
MPPSPAKRRRVASHDPIDDTEISATSINEQPTTPTRASYLSPTKSSLARSHPHLIPRTTRRSLTEPRGASLRDEIRDEKSSASEPPETASRISQPPDRMVNESRPAQGDKNFPDQAPNASQKDPRTANTSHPPMTSRSPLRERQKPHINGHGTRGFSHDSMSPAIMPTLVRRTDPSTRATSHHASNEPELPPTPVQLGISTVPERPRGLASSSSPRGSKTGSGKRRKRTRADGPMTSSPLKPKARSPGATGNEALESSTGFIDEAKESELEGPEDEDVEDVSANLKEKQATLQSLKETLEQLKKENERLGTVLANDEEVGDEYLSLLRQTSTEDPASQQKLPESFDLGDDALAYLTLFSPGNLQLKSRTETKKIRGRLKIIHFLAIDAPPPWLPNVLACEFEVIVDAEDVRVESVRMEEAITDKRRGNSTKPGIYKWIRDRLQHPLHCLDVGGVIWGMGRWFSAMVERAKVFQRLEKVYRNSSSSSADDEEGDEEWTRSKTIELSRYLDMTQIQIAYKGSNSKNRSKKGTATVMLMWDIDLDWTGGVTSNISIAVSGVSSKAQAGSKEVFCCLIPAKGVIGAFKGVWELIHSETNDGTGAEEGKGKRKRT